MSSDSCVKPKDTIWWIVSIATSVACCALLILFFGGNLSDLRGESQSTASRLTAMEEQESQILREVGEIRKRGEQAATTSPSVGMPAEVPASAVPSGDVMPPSIGGGPVVGGPETAPPVQPHVEVPVVSPAGSR